MKLQMDAQVFAIKALPVVNMLSQYTAYKGKPAEFGVELRCYKCRDHDSCQKRQHHSRHPSASSRATKRTTMGPLVSLFHSFSLSIYFCVCVRERERERKRQTDTHRDREKSIERERARESARERARERAREESERNVLQLRKLRVLRQRST